MDENAKAGCAGLMILAACALLSAGVGIMAGAGWGMLLMAALLAAWAFWLLCGGWRG